MREKGFHDGMTVPEQHKLPQQKHYLKITDDATGEIAAYAVWIHLPEGYCTEDEYVDVCPSSSIKLGNADERNEFQQAG